MKFLRNTVGCSPFRPQKKRIAEELKITPTASSYYNTEIIGCSI
jgi:predicted transcriptional regulator